MDAGMPNQSPVRTVATDSLNSQAAGMHGGLFKTSHSEQNETVGIAWGIQREILCDFLGANQPRFPIRAVRVGG